MVALIMTEEEIGNFMMTPYQRRVLRDLSGANVLLKEIKELLGRERVIVIKQECCCKPVPVPLRRKVGTVQLPKGQSMSAVKFTGVKSTPASAGDARTNVFVVTVEGFQPYEVSVPFTPPVTAGVSVVTCDLVIPKGANYHVYDYDIDEDGNRSSPSVPFDGVATDGIAFSKTGSVDIPAGNTVDDSELPPMVPVTPPTP